MTCRVTKCDVQKCRIWKLPVTQWFHSSRISDHAGWLVPAWTNGFIPDLQDWNVNLFFFFFLSVACQQLLSSFDQFNIVRNGRATLPYLSGIKTWFPFTVQRLGYLVCRTFQSLVEFLVCFGSCQRVQVYLSLDCFTAGFTRSSSSFWSTVGFPVDAGCVGLGRVLLEQSISKPGHLHHVAFALHLTKFKLKLSCWKNSSPEALFFDCVFSGKHLAQMFLLEAEEKH